MEKLFSLTKKDFDIEWYRPGGHGGQKRDKTSSACRITHAPSKTTAQCQDFREATKNKALAFTRLTEHPHFKKWMRIEIAKSLGVISRIEDDVEKTFIPSNLRIEGKNENGRWTLLTE